MTTKIKRLCECGCGNYCNNRFCRGHNNKLEEGKEFLRKNNHMYKKESREKLSKIMKYKHHNDPEFIKTHRKSVRTKEYREKISRATKKLFSEDSYREKFSQRMKEVCSTNEWRTKQSEIQKETWKSKFLRDKVSGKNHPFYGKFGEEHPSFIKDLVRYYCPIWSSKELKDMVKERDDFVCQNPLCGNTEKLVVHHIDYDKMNCELNNLITLCCSCNAQANADRWGHEVMYKAIVIRQEKNRIKFLIKRQMTMNKVQVVDPKEIHKLAKEKR